MEMSYFNKYFHAIRAWIELQTIEPEERVELPNLSIEQIIITVRRDKTDKKVKIAVEVIGCFEKGKHIEIIYIQLSKALCREVLDQTLENTCIK